MAKLLIQLLTPWDVQEVEDGCWTPTLGTVTPEMAKRYIREFMATPCHTPMKTKLAVDLADKLPSIRAIERQRCGRERITILQGRMSCGVLKVYGPPI
jgi:hypothetical protein